MLKKVTDADLRRAREHDEEVENRQEWLDDYAFELELFETHELPVFVMLVEIEGFDAEALLGACYDLTRSSWLRGRTTMEVAKIMYDWGDITRALQLLGLTEDPYGIKFEDLEEDIEQCDTF